MAFDIGSVVAKVDADISGFKNGMNEAKGQVSSFKDHVGSAGESVKNFATQVSVVSAVVAGAFTLMAKSALESSASFEQSRIAFETMLGSADEAKKLLREISDFAMKTPFELPQLVEGSKKLLAYNVSAKDIIPTMKMLGDITSGVGVEKMPQLILAFGQVKAATKLTGMELRQFSEAGVPLLQALADNAKKSAKDMIDAISKGEVSFEDVQKALSGMTAEGGKFFMGMERQSKTFNGVVSNIKDQVGRIFRSIMGIDEAGDIRQGSLFQKIAEGANNLLTFLTNATPQILAFVDRVGQVFNQIGEFIKPFINWIIANKEVATQFFIGLAAAIGLLLLIAPLIVIAMNPVILVFTAIVVAAGLLYAAWQTNFWGIRDITMTVINELVAFWNGYLFPAIAAVTAYFQAHMEQIKLIVGGAWQIITGIFQVSWAIIYGLVKFFLALISGDWQKAWDAIVGILTAAWVGIQNIFNGIINFIKGWGGWLFDELTAPFRRAWEEIKKVVENIKNALDFTKRHSPSVVDIISHSVRAVNDALGGLTVGASVNATAAGVAVSNGGAMSNITNVRIDMAGAMIADEFGAMQLAEKMGDAIIKRLQINIRV